LIRRLIVTAGAAGALVLSSMAVAPVQARAASAPGALGSVLSGTGVATSGSGVQVTEATNQSSNWFGYSEPITQGGPYQSISGSWTVPTATQHTPNQAENSATWIGIGGGCVTSDCTVGDETLVQTGTEQDVAANGQTSYSAWWEIVPVPSISFSISVHPGDQIQASLTQTAPEVWNVVLKDVTDGQSGSASQTIPYPSDYSTAEFIEETPLSVGTGGTGLTNLPNLTNTTFSNAEVNGAGAGLVTADEMDLIDANGKVIAVPSAPGTGGNSFTACTWTTSCSAP
jgi:hypothetical protein